MEGEAKKGKRDKPCKELTFVNSREGEEEGVVAHFVLVLQEWINLTFIFHCPKS